MTTHIASAAGEQITPTDVQTPITARILSGTIQTFKETAFRERNLYIKIGVYKQQHKKKRRDAYQPVKLTQDDREKVT